MKRKVITAICIGAVLAVSGCSGTASTAGDTSGRNESNAGSLSGRLQGMI